jgi:AcrR family transcriptional regulator
VNQVSNSEEPRRRPGGRTANVTARVHAAVLELLIEGGVPACTFTAVAERAQVDRSTLHRRFPDKWETIIDAFMSQGQSTLLPDDTGSFANDLRSLFAKVASLLASPLGAAMIAAAAEMRSVSRPGFVRTYFDRRLEQLAPMFDRAVARGELREETDRELLFTSAVGPLYHRLFIAGRELDVGFLDTIVSNICWLYCTPSAAAKLSLPARIA